MWCGLELNNLWSVFFGRYKMISITETYMCHLLFFVFFKWAGLHKKVYFLNQTVTKPNAYKRHLLVSTKLFRDAIRVAPVWYYLGLKKNAWCCCHSIPPPLPPPRLVVFVWSYALILTVLKYWMLSGRTYTAHTLPTYRSVWGRRVLNPQFLNAVMPFCFLGSRLCCVIFACPLAVVYGYCCYFYFPKKSEIVHHYTCRFL